MSEEITANDMITDSEEQADEVNRLNEKFKKEERKLKNYHLFLIYLAAFLLVIWVLFFLIIGITHVPNGDMSPRMDAGDLVIFYRLDKTPQFGEVIVFEKDIDGSGKKQMLVARVIAVPGDTVAISAGNRPVINGNTLIEPDIFRETPKREDRITYPLHISTDEYFVLVDSREEGVDSRYFGTVKKDEILGTIITLLRRHKL